MTFRSPSLVRRLEALEQVLKPPPRFFTHTVDMTDGDVEPVDEAAYRAARGILASDTLVTVRIVPDAPASAAEVDPYA